MFATVRTTSSPSQNANGPSAVMFGLITFHSVTLIITDVALQPFAAVTVTWY
ncbi:hypothetical protein D3C80_2236300 [compost metagenome]